jgi:hypothetical protein
MKLEKLLEQCWSSLNPGRLGRENKKIKIYPESVKNT